MQILNFLLWQLLHFGLAWLLFGTITFYAARYTPWWCVPFGYFAVAVTIYWLDATWVQAEMRKPGWDGTPDLDMIFMFGVLIRIFIVNMFLVPLTVLGVWLRRRQKRLRYGLRVA